MSGEARKIERIHVGDNDGLRLLIDNVTLVDPKNYNEPVLMRGVWRFSPETPIMEYVCCQNIYDEYIAEKRGLAAGGDGGD